MLIDCDIIVQSIQEPPPVPQIVSIRFNNDGGSILILFDSDTDRGGISSFFNCSLLLNFFRK